MRHPDTKYKPNRNTLAGKLKHATKRYPELGVDLCRLLVAVGEL